MWVAAATLRYSTVVHHCHMQDSGATAPEIIYHCACSEGTKQLLRSYRHVCLGFSKRKTRRNCFSKKRASTRTHLCNFKTRKTPLKLTWKELPREILNPGRSWMNWRRTTSRYYKTNDTSFCGKGSIAPLSVGFGHCTKTTKRNGAAGLKFCSLAPRCSWPRSQRRCRWPFPTTFLLVPKVFEKFLCF